jgi:hypothetical protein
MHICPLVPSSKLQLILITFGIRGPTLMLFRRLNSSSYVPNIIAALHETQIQLCNLSKILPVVQNSMYVA